MPSPPHTPSRSPAAIPRSQSDNIISRSSGSASSSPRRGGVKVTKKPKNRPTYTALQGEEHWAMGDVSPRGSRSNGKDYFALSDSSSEEGLSPSPTASPSEPQQQPPQRQRPLPSRTRTRSRHRAPPTTGMVSYAPSLLSDLHDNLDLNEHYTDSLVHPPVNISQNLVAPVTPLSANEYLALVDEVRAAIADGIYPTLISQGSSGSYFCRNRKNEIVGVFKPKNEEPYGHLNPKWTKWIHKNMFPCCFGRSCIIPNLGYVSEAAASYMDRRLGLNIVPRTEVIYLASPTFYYSRKDWKAYRSGKPLPEKIGSFQIFLKGFKDATTFFRQGYERARRSNSMSSLRASSVESGSAVGGGDHMYEWSERSQKEFRWGFERLVVLDYLIRNTDRGLDNWMVMFDEEGDEHEKALLHNGGSSPRSNGTRGAPLQPLVETDEDNNTGTGGDKHGESADPGSSPTREPSEQDSEAEKEGTTDSDKLVDKSMDGPDPTEEDPFADYNSTKPAGVVDLNNAASPDSTPAKPAAPSPLVQIAAIDNGLAFPWKHPDRWRSYPFGWAYLPASRFPFSTESRQWVLHLLTSPSWWQDTMDGLERIFRIDCDFSEKMWRRQRAVVRGQGYNLVETLRRAEVAISSVGVIGSPWELVRRPVVAVYEEVVDDDDAYGSDSDAEDEWMERGMVGAGARPPIGESRKSFLKRVGRGARKVRQRFETFARRRPCFENW
ncbi:phosphatidylinositol 3 and 4-kinase-domain-containing protein [Gaertneriomyces semiglobifer]|nr:phosphatidylinositol 3 and 4-kinase-domain-containing protein [Gaertneriomyces semiglobifer]